MRGDAVNKVNWPICQTQENAHADTKQPEHDFTLCAHTHPILFVFITILKGCDAVAVVVEIVAKVCCVQTTGDRRDHPESLNLFCDW